MAYILFGHFFICHFLVRILTSHYGAVGVLSWNVKKEPLGGEKQGNPKKVML